MSECHQRSIVITLWHYAIKASKIPDLFLYICKKFIKKILFYNFFFFNYNNFKNLYFFHVFFTRDTRNTPNSPYQNCHGWETSWLTGHLNGKRNKMSHLVHCRNNSQCASLYLHKRGDTNALFAHHFHLRFHVRKKFIL